MNVIDQLVYIYYTEEWWHKKILPPEDAYTYHSRRYNKSIHTYEENGEVLGYYERYIKDDVCTLYNIWIRNDKRRGYVFKMLKKHFFDTLPQNVKYITGEKQKLGGKIQKVRR